MSSCDSLLKAIFNIGACTSMYAFLSFSLRRQFWYFGNNEHNSTLLTIYYIYLVRFIDDCAGELTFRLFRISRPSKPTTHTRIAQIHLDFLPPQCVPMLVAILTLCPPGLISAFHQLCRSSHSVNIFQLSFQRFRSAEKREIIMPNIWYT